MLRIIANTNRYKHIKIRNYVSKLDLNRTLQFAAMEFLLPDGTSYVAYRGTDDNLVGWKEDFLLALEEVAAEREASGAITLSELKKSGLKGLHAMTKKVSDLKKV